MIFERFVQNDMHFDIKLNKNSIKETFLGPIEAFF